VHQKIVTLRGPSLRTGNFLVMESSAVMAMEGVLGLGSELLGKIRLQKAEVHGEG
jgi:hypothetical protein